MYCTKGLTLIKVHFKQPRLKAFLWTQLYIENKRCHFKIGCVCYFAETLLWRVMQTVLPRLGYKENQILGLHYGSCSPEIVFTNTPPHHTSSPTVNPTTWTFSEIIMRTSGLYTLIKTWFCFSKFSNCFQIAWMKI